MAGFYEFAEKVLALEKQGKKLVRLNVGDTNLPTPQCAIDAAIRSMKGSKASYGSSAGLPALRERIAEREGCKPGNVVIGPGSKHLLFGLMEAVCKKGERVAFPSPYWPAYRLISEKLGINAETVGTSLDEGWTWEGGFPSINGAKALILCDPLNPTSTVYRREAMESAIEAARKGGALVILDEAYKGLAFKSVSRYDGENLIRVRSFSKEFNMEGWRLGYAVAPEDIAKKLVAFNQITTTCVPPFIQEAGIACLDNERSILESNLAIWRKRSGTAQKALKKAGFAFSEPEAGIYVFATHPGIRNSQAYALKLLDSGVAVSPGSEFGGYDGFVRICVNRSEDELDGAIALMGRLAGAGP